MSFRETSVLNIGERVLWYIAFAHLQFMELFMLCSHTSLCIYANWWQWLAWSHLTQPIKGLSSVWGCIWLAALCASFMNAFFQLHYLYIVACNVFDYDPDEGHDLKCLQFIAYNKALLKFWPLEAVSDPQPENVYIYIRTAQLMAVIKKTTTPKIGYKENFK